MVGKDVANHQRRPTSHCEERYCEPFLDADHHAAEIPTREVSFKDPCEEGKPSKKVPWSRQ